MRTPATKRIVPITIDGELKTTSGSRQGEVMDQSDRMVFRELSIVLKAAIPTAKATGSSCCEITVAQNVCLRPLPRDIARIS